MIIVLDNPGTRRQLAAAVGLYCDTLRRNGRPVPPDLRDLRRSLEARGGQGRPNLDRGCYRSQIDPALLAVTYEEAGRRIGVSSRTVRRLVAQGQLEAITVAGALRRIRVVDLDAYLAAAVAEGGSGGKGQPAAPGDSVPPGAAGAPDEGDQE